MTLLKLSKKKTKALHGIRMINEIDSIYYGIFSIN